MSLRRASRHNPWRACKGFRCRPYYVAHNVFKPPSVSRVSATQRPRLIISKRSRPCRVFTYPSCALSSKSHAGIRQIKVLGRYDYEMYLTSQSCQSTHVDRSSKGHFILHELINTCCSVLTAQLRMLCLSWVLVKEQIRFCYHMVEPVSNTSHALIEVRHLTKEIICHSYILSAVIPTFYTFQYLLLTIYIVIFKHTFLTTLTAVMSLAI